MTSDDKLRELGKALPWERPDDARREALRSQLLLAAEDQPPVMRRGSRVAAGAMFAAGALAAAAVAVVVVRRGGEPGPAIAHAQITASPAAELEHSVTPTARGSDEVIRVHGGTVAIAAPGARPRDRVRVVTRDAEVEGTGAYDVTVVHDALTAVAMRSGTATVTVQGHAQPVFLSAGEVWHAEVVTAELMSSPERGTNAVSPATPTPSTPTPTPSTTPTPGATTPMPGATTPTPSTPRSASTSGTAPPAPRMASAASSMSSVARAAPATPSVASATQAVPREPSPPALPAWQPSTLAPQPVPPTPTTAPPPPTPAPSAITRLEPAAPAGTPRRPSAIERHFQAGSTLLRANKLREAAIELAAAADASDVDPLALDARYLQATALVGAGQSAAAEHALVAFLDHAPRSLRRGRAEVLLARLIAARGDVPSARAWFTAALDDPDRDVASAARTGLDALP